MRLVLAMVFAALVALPLGVSAQEAGEGATSEPNAVQESAPEEPALQLQLDDAGVEVVPSTPRTADGYTVEEMELRVKRAKIGLGVSAGVAVAGVVPLVLGYRGDSCYAACASCAEPGEPQSCNRMRIAGWTVTGVGGVSMIVTGILVGARTAELRSLAADHTPEEMELRVKRAKIGLGVSGGVLLVGFVMVGVALVALAEAGIFNPPQWVDRVVWTGFALVVGGVVGMITSGVMLRVRKRELRGRQGKLHYGTPRRVQWDLARSRLVF